MRLGKQSYQRYGGIEGQHPGEVKIAEKAAQRFPLGTLPVPTSRARGEAKNQEAPSGNLKM